MTFLHVCNLRIKFEGLLSLSWFVLAQMSTRRGTTEVHEFHGTFQGSHVQYKVTSVIGHVFRFLFSLVNIFLL